MADEQIHNEPVDLRGGHLGQGDVHHGAATDAAVAAALGAAQQPAQFSGGVHTVFNGPVSADGALAGEGTVINHWGG